VKSGQNKVLSKISVNKISCYYKKIRLTTGQLSDIIWTGQLSGLGFIAYVKSANNKDVLHEK
jgi:hypothetical protein